MAGQGHQLCRRYSRLHVRLSANVARLFTGKFDRHRENVVALVVFSVPTRHASNSVKPRGSVLSCLECGLLLDHIAGGLPLVPCAHHIGEHVDMVDQHHDGSQAPMAGARQPRQARVGRDIRDVHQDDLQPQAPAEELQVSVSLLRRPRLLEERAQAAEDNHEVEDALRDLVVEHGRRVADDRVDPRRERIAGATVDRRHPLEHRGLVVRVVVPTQEGWQEERRPAQVAQKIRLIEEGTIVATMAGVEE
mmetsp:Transcript_67659/g.174316  ORF Transcript_67659/g.174316 Transcript_67659/m.174316 type:complete len:249 (+) Transcript_67659:232-978(+)